MSVFGLVVLGVLLLAVVFGARRERPHDGPGRRSDGHLNAGVAAGGYGAFGGVGDGGAGGAGCGGDGGGAGTC